MAETSVTPDRPTFVYEPDTAAGGFVMLIAKENEPTVDGRMFATGAVSWRELPISLTMNRVNTAEGQHKTAVGIGTVTEVWRDGNDIFGRGYFSTDEEGQEARELIRQGTISGVSADVGGVISEELTADETYPEGVRKVITKGTIIGVTALLHSSFNETKIAIDEAPITAAAGAPWTPSADMFADPKLSAPTPFTITADGRVFGHAALWDTCHVGYRDRCVRPPHSKSGYAYFNTGTVLTASSNAVNVGRITADTGHASLELAAQPAKEHYDHTGFAAAFVAAGEDAHGIWFSGMIAPTATDGQVANLRAAGVSGDWRNIGGSLEMVGLLAVNTPGFPVPRPAAGLVAGAQMSLVAAGAMVPEMDIEELAAGKPKPCCKECGDAEVATVKGEMSAEGVEENSVYRNGSLVEWSTDQDSVFLTQLGEKINDVLQLAAQGNESDSALSTTIQSFASWLEMDLSPTIDQINRSLGRTETVPEAEKVATATDAAYEAGKTEELSIETRLTLLDADLLML